MSQYTTATSYRFNKCSVQRPRIYHCREHFYRMLTLLIVHKTRVKLILQKAASLGSFGYLRHSTQLVDIFYHIRQVAARVAKLVPICAFVTPILGEEEIVGGSAMVPFERAIVDSSNCLSILTIALCLTIQSQLAVECLRRPNQQEVGHFVAKFGKEGVDRCKPNFCKIWDRHGAVI